MRNDRKEPRGQKPAVVVRKKAGKGSTPAAPTETKPRQALPAEKTETPAEPLQPPPKPQQPEASTQPQTIDDAVLSKTAERKRRRNEILEILRARWPQTFPRDFREIRPWAKGIAQDVARLLPEQPHRGVKDAISIYRMMATPSYCHALFKGGPRYDLDGNPRGEITQEEQERARQDLKVFYERRKKKAAARALAASNSSPQSPDEAPGQGPTDSLSVSQAVDAKTE